MKYKAHSATGFAVGSILAYYGDASFLEGTLLVGSAGLGSLLPDIDHRGSWIGRRLKVVSKIVGFRTSHRGATHAPLVTILFAAFMYGLVALWSPAVALYGAVGLLGGMWSHIALDALTKGGVPLLFPLTKKKFRIASFRTGGALEKWIEAIATLLFIGYGSLAFFQAVQSYF